MFNVKFIIILLLFIIVLKILQLIIIDKVRIKWKTFLKKGFLAKRGNFGLYCYTGQQGKGKTYSLVEYVYDNRDKSYFFSNVTNITCLNDTNCTYFKGLNALYQLVRDFDNGLYDELIKDKQVVFIYDELLGVLSKKKGVPEDFMSFITQLRKRKVIFLTTAQVWSPIPKEFRELCRYQINCNMIPLINDTILIKEFRDAENMKWVQDEQEFVAPIVETTITKARKEISNSYNTLERITNHEVNANEKKESIS